MKRKAGFITTLLFLVLLTAAGCKAKEPVAEQAPAAPEKSALVEAFGTVEVDTVSSLSVDFPVTVKQLNVESGQLVTAGEVLAVLDISNISNSLRQYDFEVQKLQNELDTKQKLFEKSNKDLVRGQALLEAGAMTETEYEEYTEAANQVAGEIKSLEISIAKARADQGQLRKQLGKNYLKGSSLLSPFEQGLVSEVNCYEGEMVSTPRSMISIMDLNSLYVEAEIPEEFIGDIKPDARVTIIPVADTGKEYQGRITSISNIARERAGETIIPVKISIATADGFLKPKYNVDVKVAVE